MLINVRANSEKLHDAKSITRGTKIRAAALTERFEKPPVMNAHVALMFDVDALD